MHFLVFHLKFFFCANIIFKIMSQENHKIWNYLSLIFHCLIRMTIFTALMLYHTKSVGCMHSHGILCHILRPFVDVQHRPKTKDNRMIIAIHFMTFMIQGRFKIKCLSPLSQEKFVWIVRAFCFNNPSQEGCDWRVVCGGIEPWETGEMRGYQPIEQSLVLNKKCLILANS